MHIDNTISTISKLLEKNAERKDVDSKDFYKWMRF